MAKSQKIADRRPDLSDVRGLPIRAHMRPPLPGAPAERGNVSPRALARRVHAEFLEMPGLTLSLQQAARLFSLPTSVCKQALGELIDDDLLCMRADGRYALPNNRGG